MPKCKHGNFNKKNGCKYCRNEAQSAVEPLVSPCPFGLVTCFQEAYREKCKHKDRLAEEIGEVSRRLNEEIDRLNTAIGRVANECNCRAEHGAEGAEHLLSIEKMLRSILLG